MGILSRLFSKQDEEALKRLEKNFQSLLGKSKSEWICLVGIRGTTKGLDVISSLDTSSKEDIKDLKRVNGRAVELFLRYLSLEFPRSESDPPLQYISYYFSEQEQICIFPIENNDQFIITAKTRHPEKIQKEIIKVRIELYKLKLERGE